MLLVGVGGSGRQSLAIFATKLQKLCLWQVRVNRTYGVRDFRDELKQLIVKAGETKGINGSLFSVETTAKQQTKACGLFLLCPQA